jgi:uncharacterized protein
MTLIENLLNLYRVDMQVRALRSRLEAAQRYLAAQVKQLDDLNRTLEELQRRKRHHQASSGNLETEVRGLDQRIEKLREELNAASTNKQYNAFLTELNTLKVEKRKVEDRALLEMEQIETLDAQLTDVRSRLGERQRVRDVAQSQLEQRQADIGERLAELEREREQAAANVPARELDVFESVADQFEGEVMSPVEEINRRHREYACGSCHMHLPFEKVSLLLSSGESIVRCTACGRILHMQEEVRGSLAKK